MKWVFCILCLSFTILSHSQEVVKWDISYSSGEKMVLLNANIQKGWHLYSQHIENNVGPVPTSFSFKSSNDFILKGEVQEPKPIQKYDENFEAMLDFFEKEVTFKQNIDVSNSTVVDITITYMVCNETMCLPPVDQKFKLEINL